MKKRFILFCILTVGFCPCSFAASEVTTRNTTSSNTLAQTEEFGPLQIVIQDLQDSSSLIDDGNKKTALVILKSALNEVRKVKELSSKQKKQVSNYIKGAINYTKKGDNTNAKTHIDYALSVLQTV